MDERYAAVVLKAETLMRKQQQRREEADSVRCGALIGGSCIPRSTALIARSFSFQYHMLLSQQDSQITFPPRRCIP